MPSLFASIAINDAPAPAAATDWPAVKAEIIARLDLRHEFTLMGVRFTGHQSGDKLECCPRHRDNDEAHGFVNVKTGKYHCSGDGGETLGFWDFAVKYGEFGEYKEALQHFAAKAGVAIGRINKKSGGRVEDGWIDYLQADGSVHYRKFRYIKPNGKKTFTQHPPDGRGGWRWGSDVMKGYPRIPYHLPDIVNRPGETIWWNEGEKAADAIRSLGLIGTTADNGSDVTDSDLAQVLPYCAGRDVVFLPDNDAPGRKLAERVCRHLAGIARTVKRLDLPGLPPKGDAVEWIADGGTVERLEALAEACSLWEPGATAEAETEEDAAEDLAMRKARLGILCVTDIEVRPVTWLWPERIPLGKITLLGGEGEIGKTFLTCDLIARITTGRPFPGEMAGGPPRGCIFVTAEDGMDDTIKPRLLAMGANTDLVHTITTGIGSDGKLMPFSLADIPRLQETIDVLPESCVIAVDPITSFVGKVDDNKNTELRTVLTPLSEFAGQRGVSILAITHFGKNPTARGVGRILGSVAYSNAARAVWCVVADPDDPDRKLMLRGKNNLSPIKTGFAYRVEDRRVVWESDPIDLRLDDVLAHAAAKFRDSGHGGPRNNKTIECNLWILDLLKGGPMRQKDIIDAGLAHPSHFSVGTVCNALKLGGVSEIKNHGGRGILWQLSGDDVVLKIEN